MCNDVFNDQEQFMRAGKQTVGRVNATQSMLYVSLIKEEFNEFIEAVENENGGFTKADFVKEAIDLVVVTLGFLVSQGVNGLKIWNLVLQNNLAKVYESTIKDDSGKIMKSPESEARKVAMMEKIKAECDIADHPIGGKK